MKSIIRVRQGCVSRVAPNAGSGRIITKKWAPNKPLTAALYHYKTQNAVPAQGNITCTATQVRINGIDLYDIDHSASIATLKPGDSIIIGPQTGVIVLGPVETSGYFIFDMATWPALADGDYSVSTIRV